MVDEMMNDGRDFHSLDRSSVIVSSTMQDSGGSIFPTHHAGAFPLSDPILRSIQVGRPAEHGTEGAEDPMDSAWTSGFYKSR